MNFISSMIFYSFIYLVSLLLCMCTWRIYMCACRWICVCVHGMYVRVYIKKMCMCTSRCVHEKGAHVCKKNMCICTWSIYVYVHEEYMEVYMKKLCMFPHRRCMCVYGEYVYVLHVQTWRSKEDVERLSLSLLSSFFFIKDPLLNLTWGWSPANLDYHISMF